MVIKYLPFAKELPFTLNTRCLNNFYQHSYNSFIADRYSTLKLQVITAAVSTPVSTVTRSTNFNLTWNQYTNLKCNQLLNCYFLQLLTQKYLKMEFTVVELYTY